MKNEKQKMKKLVPKKGKVKKYEDKIETNGRSNAEGIKFKMNKS